MSQTHSPDQRSVSLDIQVRRITAQTFHHIHEGTATNREISIAIEANQKYADYLDWLKDNAISGDQPITVEVDGTQIQFKNDDEFSDWLQEQMT